jgi:hypothetical protein
MDESVRYEHAERVRDFYRNQGAAKERERIIELIESRSNATSRDALISLIKGETE